MLFLTKMFSGLKKAIFKKTPHSEGGIQTTTFPLEQVAFSPENVDSKRTELYRNCCTGNVMGIFESKIPLEKRMGIVYDMIKDNSDVIYAKDLLNYLEKVSLSKVSSEFRKDFTTLETLLRIRIKHDENEKKRGEVIFQQNAERMKRMARRSRLAERFGHLPQLNDIPLVEYSKKDFKSYLLGELPKEYKMSQLRREKEGEVVGLGNTNGGVSLDPYVASEGVMHSESLKKYGFLN
jgi:hypothetical protein